MELEDCEDVLQDFTGGTLELNKDDLKSPCSENNTLITPTNSHVDDNNQNRWGNTLISPIVSIPQRLTERVWPKNQDNSCVKPIVSLFKGNACDFFTFRQSIIEQAVKESIKYFSNETDTSIWSAFLLTEISLWDAEKERLVLILPQFMVVIKYDFIALRRLEHKIIPLRNIDTIIMGDLVYPTASIVPHLNGFADGLSSIVQNCLFDAWTKNKTNNDLPKYFRPSNRNMHGVRLMWNKGKPLNFGSKWNPLSSDVPFITFTSHPLYFHKECTNDEQSKVYNVDKFIENMLSSLNCNGNDYSMDHKNILMENYVGIGSLIHNRNGLGFFKVRGRFSF